MHLFVWVAIFVHRLHTRSLSPHCVLLANMSFPVSAAAKAVRQPFPVKEESIAKAPGAKKPRIVGKAAKTESPVDVSGIVPGSAEDFYVPCANQNGGVDSPCWYFFRMYKTDRSKGHPECNRCYCQVPGCTINDGLAQRTSSGGTKALKTHMGKHGWPSQSPDDIAKLQAEVGRGASGHW